MTDSGSACKSKLFAEAIDEQGMRHKRTRPYTPRTNGKAERFIQTSLREWAYAQPFETSAARAQAMPAWLCTYNRTRPHAALNGKPSISRLPKGDNLLGNDSEMATSRSVISAENRSPRLSQDGEFGVKGRWKRGCCASDAVTAGCL
jgi:hypothetical protein